MAIDAYRISIVELSCTLRIHSSFPLIQPSFVKLANLSQFDEISYAW